LSFFAPDGITDFGIALAFCRPNSSTVISLSALSFDKSTDQKLFLTEYAITKVLTSFICSWFNARIADIGRKVRYLYDEQRSQFDCGYLLTAEEVTESLILYSNHSRTSFKHANSIVFATFVQ